MKNNFNGYKINFTVIDTKSELIESLARFKNNSLLIGQDSEVENKFTLIELYKDDISDSYFGIGIISESSIKPEYLMVKSANKLFLGFNKEVNFFDIQKKENEIKIELGTRFSTFIEVENIILIMFETGCLSVTQNGNEIWKIDKDVVEDFTIDGNLLELRFIDENFCKVSIKDGKIL
jgi:predicted transport protein